MAAETRLGGGSEAERQALRALVLEHLEAEGVQSSLVLEVRSALENASGGQGCGSDSRLLQALRRSSAVEACAVLEPAPGQQLIPDEDIASAAVSTSSRRVQECSTQSRAAGPCAGVVPLVIVIFSSLTFLPCVTYSQWYIDELFAAVRNADARGETPLRKLLSHDFWGNPLWDGGWTHKSYRPLVVLSYALQYCFNSWIIKPQPLRAFNVTLHATNSLLTHWLLRRNSAAWHWACLASCLFALHPVHAENVIYLVGRADALATLCWLLALLSWPRRRRSRSSRRLCRHCCSGALRLLLVTLLAVIGGLCKESGFCVLFQLAVHELLFSTQPPLRGSVVPLLTVFGAVFASRSWLTGGTKAGFSFVDTPVQYHDDARVRLFTYLYFHAKYAQLMVFPWTLSWDYSYDALPLLHQTWGDARCLAVLAAYLGLVALASWGAANRSGRVLFALSNVVVPFVPASNLFFTVGVTVGERLLYPCNVGGAMLVAAVGSSSAQSTSRTGQDRRSRRLFPVGIVLFCVFAFRCGLRVYQWSDRATLFGPDALSYPRSAKARHQFGTVLHRRGRFDEALVHFHASLDLYKANALTEYCIAQILIETGRAQEALTHFEGIFKGHALGFGSFNIYALYVDYGFTLMLLRRFEDAVPQLMHGLKLNEDVPHGLNALGYCFMQLHRPEEARGAFERGLHYEPSNAYLVNNLGVTLLLAGEHQTGVELVARAIEAEPQVPAFAHNARVVRALAETGVWPPDRLVLELFFNRGN